MNIRLDCKNVLNFMNEEEPELIKPAVLAAHNTLHNKTGAGSDFTGWLDLPENYDKDEF